MQMAFPYSETSFSLPNAAPRIDAVLFDYGQVLSNPPDPVAWARLRSITGLDEDSLHAAYWKFRHDYDRGALTGPAYWHAVAAHAGIDIDAVRLIALLAVDVDVWTSLNQPMVDWAGRLQRAGVRTGILSNIGDSIANGIIARLPWLSGFDHCTWSHTMSMAKPEAAIYLRTAEAMNTAPANILFMDDREENISAAIALGFQTLHFTNYSAFEREMCERGFESLLNAGLGSEGSSVSAKSEREPEPAAK
jgi:putative hydrolase of the HAD superfamily